MYQSKKNLARIVNENKIINPYDLANSLKIMIISVPLNLKIKGFHQYSPEVKLLHINENLNSIDKFTILCHGIENICKYPNHNMIFSQNNFTIINKDYYKNNRITLNYSPLEDLMKKYNFD